MRYLLHAERYGEVPARMKFLEETFNLWFIPKGTIDRFVILESLPPTAEKDTCLIYGHNTEVANLLKNNRSSVFEKNIYIISCLTEDRKDFAVPSKHVYITPQIATRGIELHKGNEFGFDFDISDIELFLFNSSIPDPKKKLNSLFERL